ncbi:sigma 54-interacting transcriptional regulator [Candidatus Dependentiae bacterium]
MMFFDLVKTAFDFLGSFPFLLVIRSASFLTKSFIFIVLARKAIKINKMQRNWIFVLLFLIGSMVSDSSWVLIIAKKMFFNDFGSRLVGFWVRMAWAMTVVQYQSLALFIEGFLTQKGIINLRQKIFIGISSVLWFIFVVLSIYSLGFEPRRLYFESKLLEVTILYLFIPLMLSSLIITLYKLAKSEIPRILKRQIKIFISLIVVPLLLSEFAQNYPFKLSQSVVLAHSLKVVGISAILVTCGILYCVFKIMRLRFLNLDNHVKSPKRFHFIEDFKNIIEQFGNANTLRELDFITQHFFMDAFGIPLKRAHLTVRDFEKSDKMSEIFVVSPEERIVEAFVSRYDLSSKIGKFVHKSKVLIADELEFSNFYENDEDIEKIINFMKGIAADIFIPIYEKDRVKAYIFVERYSRINTKNKNAKFYGDVERDQMSVFADYLANVIKSMQSKNLSSLIEKNKYLQEELYLKHQENNQYKESIRSFLRNSNHKHIGFIFYKDRRFSFGNKTAYELVPIKLNTYSGHPITKKLAKIARDVLEYKSPQSCFINDSGGQKLVATAILNIDRNNVIISVHYPEVSDILKKNIEMIKDPTKLDYLLYLETTKYGKLIDDLIPGRGEKTLNFKLDLLNVALSKKAILLDLNEDDLMPTVQVLHQISLREHLHVLDLKRPSSSFDTAVKLFGISPIFGIKNDDTKPLLEKLDRTGTLFIKNIDFMEMETQKYLAEFIKYGYYRQFKSDKRMFSDVRVLCSPNSDLKIAVEKKEFSVELYNELKATSIVMPSLNFLSDSELGNISADFASQAMQTGELENVLELTDKDKRTLINSKPVSFSEIKIKVRRLLEEKSKDNAIYEETQFDYDAGVSDPLVVEAARLGKHALRDKKIMTMLWDKFENQSKIANILGVNRSSVNRRCKVYGIIPDLENSNSDNAHSPKL